MNHNDYSDIYLKDILQTVKSIAVVGASPKEIRPSYKVSQFLASKGYETIPVNPGQAGNLIAGNTAVATLSDINQAVDMIDIFRRSDAVLGVVEQALTLQPLPKVIWMQLGVRHDEAAEMAEANGFKVVMDRCPKIEFARLFN